MMDEEAGVGLPLYQPAGARIIRILQEWLRKELYRRGYEEVITPHIYQGGCLEDERPLWLLP